MPRCSSSAARWSWASSTSRRIPSPTAASSSTRQVAIAHAGAMAGQGADILDIGAESTRPYGGAKPVSADDEMARLAPVLPAAVKLGLPVSIDTIKASVAAWALDQGAAIVNDVWGLQRDPDMAPLVAERGVPVIVMHNRDERRSEPSTSSPTSIAFFSRSLEIAARAGIAREQDRARSRHRLRQDAGAKHHLHRAAGRIQALRPAAAGRRLAQALHQFGDARRRRTSASAARSPAICWRSKMARRSSARMTWRKPCRRCGSPPPSRRRDDRPHLHQRAVAARLSRRDGARGQGRADLHASTSSSTSICPTPRARTSWRIPCPTTRWSNARARRSARSASG